MHHPCALDTGQFRSRRRAVSDGQVVHDDHVARLPDVSVQRAAARGEALGLQATQRILRDDVRRRGGEIERRAFQEQAMVRPWAVSSYNGPSHAGPPRETSE